MIIIETEWRAQLDRMRDRFGPAYCNLTCCCEIGHTGEASFEWRAYHGNAGNGATSTTAGLAVDSLVNQSRENVLKRCIELREQLANLERSLDRSKNL